MEVEFFSHFSNEGLKLYPLTHLHDFKLVLLFSDRTEFLAHLTQSPSW